MRGLFLKKIAPGSRSYRGRLEERAHFFFGTYAHTALNGQVGHARYLFLSPQSRGQRWGVPLSFPCLAGANAIGSDLAVRKNCLRSPLGDSEVKAII